MLCKSDAYLCMCVAGKEILALECSNLSFFFHSYTLEKCILQTMQVILYSISS